MNQKAVCPFHLEAYPRLVLKEALHEVRTGRTLQVWRDENGVLVGACRVAETDPQRLRVSAMLRALPYIQHSTTHDEIVTNTKFRESGVVDVLTTCRSCGLEVRVVVLRNGTWLCRSCQRLSYRSALLSKTVGESERLAKIQRKLIDGRPKGMRKAAFLKLQEERLWLEFMLDDRRPVAPEHQRRHLTCQWQAEPPPLDLPEPSGTQESSADILEVVGRPLFAGPTLKSRVEQMILGELKTAYAKLLAEHGRVTELRLRRGFRDMTVGPLAKLSQESDMEVSADRNGVLVASEMMTFDGEGGAFYTGLAVPPIFRVPLGKLEDGELTVAVRFSRNNATLAAIELASEVALVRACLASLEQARQQVHDQFSSWVKLIVKEQWSKLKPPRRRRRT
jgi:hypothetical protein